MWYRYGLKFKEIDHIFIKKEEFGNVSRYKFNFTLNNHILPLNINIIKDPTWVEDDCSIKCKDGIFILKSDNYNYDKEDKIDINLISNTDKRCFLINIKEFIKLVVIFIHEFGHYMQIKNNNQHSDVYLEVNETGFEGIGYLYPLQVKLRQPYIQDYSVQSFEKFFNDHIDFFIKIFSSPNSYLSQIKACLSHDMNTNTFVSNFDPNLWALYGYEHAIQYHSEITNRLLILNYLILRFKSFLAESLKDILKKSKEVIEKEIEKNVVEANAYLHIVNKRFSKKRRPRDAGSIEKFMNSSFAFELTAILAVCEIGIGDIPQEIQEEVKKKTLERTMKVVTNNEEALRQGVREKIRKEEKERYIKSLQEDTNRLIVIRKAMEKEKNANILRSLENEYEILVMRIKSIKKAFREEFQLEIGDVGHVV
jgi:hypothetical protein